MNAICFQACLSCLVVMKTTPAKFKTSLFQESTESLVECLFDWDCPHIFGKSPKAYRTLREFLAGRLDTDPEDIRVVGSALLGFSLSPTQVGDRPKFGIPFGDDSDVDIVVVSKQLFDEFWFSLLRWNHESKWSMSRWRQMSAERAIQGQKSGIFWGFMMPQYLTFSKGTKMWKASLRLLSLIPEMSRWESKARLYRTWEHAKLYHMNSLNKLRQQLSS